MTQWTSDLWSSYRPWVLLSWAHGCLAESLRMACLRQPSTLPLFWPWWGICRCSSCYYCELEERSSAWAPTGKEVKPILGLPLYTYNVTYTHTHIFRYVYICICTCTCICIYVRMTIETLAVEHTLIEQDMLLAYMTAPVRACKVNQHARIFSSSLEMFT